MTTRFSLSAPLSAPLKVLLNVNNLCNLQCPYCYSDSGPSKRVPELTREELLGLADELGAMRVFSVNVLGGEPLLRKDLFELLARLRHHRISVELVTNGTLLKPDQVTRLRDLGVNVSLSIDGGSEETNRELRGRGSFAKAYRAAQLLGQAGSLTSVAMTVTRLNIRHVREFVETFHDIGARSLDFNRLYPTHRVRQRWNELFPRPSESAALAAELAEIQHTYPGLKLGGSYVGWATKYRGAPARGEQDDGYWACGAGLRTCIVRPDGWVTPCNSMWEYTCGNVREQSFREIWESAPGLKRLRDLASVPYTEQTACNGCSHRASCRGGCHAAALAAEGTVFGRDPICWEFNGQVRRDSDFEQRYRPKSLRSALDSFSVVANPPSPR